MDKNTKINDIALYESLKTLIGNANDPERKSNLTKSYVDWFNSYGATIEKMVIDENYICSRDEYRNIFKKSKWQKVLGFDRESWNSILGRQNECHAYVDDTKESTSDLFKWLVDWFRSHAPNGHQINLDYLERILKGYLEKGYAINGIDSILPNDTYVSFRVLKNYRDENNFDEKMVDDLIAALKPMKMVKFEKEDELLDMFIAVVHPMKCNRFGEAFTNEWKFRRDAINTSFRTKVKKFIEGGTKDIEVLFDDEVKSIISDNERDDLRWSMVKHGYDENGKYKQFFPNDDEVNGGIDKIITKKKKLFNRKFNKMMAA